MTLKSEKLVKVFGNWVPLRVHADKTAQAYNFARDEYLPDWYLHPVFVMLGPDGEDIDVKDRVYHEALTPEQLAETLEKSLKKAARGLTRGQYAKAADQYARALRELEAGKAADALNKLRVLAMIEAPSALKRRAVVLADDIEGAAEFFYGLAAAAVKAGAGDVASEVVEHLKEKYSGLDAAKKAGRLNTETETEADGEKAQALSDAYFSAASREYGEAAGTLAKLGEEGKKLAAEAKKLTAAGLGIESVAVHKKGEKQAYYDLRVRFTTGAAGAGPVRVNYYFLTDKGKLYAGSEEFEGIKPLSTYRCCAAVSGEMMAGAQIVNARAEMRVNGTLVSHKDMKASEEKWWEGAQVGDVLFYKEGQTGWRSGALKVKSAGPAGSGDR